MTSALRKLASDVRRGQGAHALMKKSGTLWAGIRLSHLSASSLSVSDRVYAAIHQFGGVIKPGNAPALKFRIGGRWAAAKQVTIPARLFFPATPAAASPRRPRRESPEPSG